MRRADIRKVLEDIRMRLEAGRRDVAFRQEGKAVIYHIVGEIAAIGICRGLLRIEFQHVGQDAVLVDLGDRLVIRVVARMPHQMDEHPEPALAVVDRLAGVVLFLGVVGVEEAADAGMPGAIDMQELAVAPEAAPAPDPDLRLGIDLARWHLDHHREHIGSVLDSTPVQGDLPPRWGAVKFRRPRVSNRFLIPS